MTFRPIPFAVVLSLVSAFACEAGVVRGVVLETKSRQPVPFARAYAFLPGQENTVQSQAQADSFGVFYLNNVPAGVITLRVAADWHIPWNGGVTMGGERDTEKVNAELGRLPVPGTVSGVVTFENWSKPGRHAHVRIKGTDNEGTADSLGYFSVYGVGAGNQTLEVVALGYDVVHVPIVTEEARTTVVHLDLGYSLMKRGSAPQPPDPSLADTAGAVRFTVADTSHMPARLGMAPQRYVTVEILKGDKVVRKLMDWTATPGPYTVVWDGRDGSGKTLGAGTYRYRATVDKDAPLEGDIVKK